MDRLRWPRKHGLTKQLKLIRRRWQNIRANTRSSLTGLKLTEKSKNRQSKTSQTLITRSSSTIRRTPTRNCRCPKSRSSQTCISQVSCRNRASFFLSVVAHSRLDRQLFVSFKLFCNINKWMLSSPKSMCTTALRATGKALLPSKN